MLRPLLLSRRFAPLFWCQFFAAFNDNFLKTSLVFLILFGADVTQSEAAVLITLASAIFIAPYFFLSGLGGELADRHDKARVARWLKFLEIFVALIAVAGYARQSLLLMFIALFGFGLIAALFGPIKYGILPDHLDRERLPSANALIEGATFIAILTGTIVGGMAAQAGGRMFAWLVIGFAVACWLSALRIPPSGEGAPHLTVNRNIAASTVAMIRHLRADSRLWWGAMVTSWFWLVGIVVMSLLPPLIKSIIGGNEDTVTAYLALFSIAIGVGSGLAALIARGRIVLKTTLAGAVLLAVCAIDLGATTYAVTLVTTPLPPEAIFATPLGLRAAIDLAGLALGGGLFIVPAFAAVQAWSDADYRARTVAAVNVLNAAFMTGATVLVALLQHFGVSVPMLFLGIGVTTFLVAAAIWKTMPSAYPPPA